MAVSKNLEQCNALFSAVGCVCIHQNEILLLRRNKDKSHPFFWGVPTGKIDSNESEISTIIRELYEETGIVLSGERFIHVNTYCVTTEEVSFTYALYYAKFRDLPQIVINPDEHNDYRWVHYEKLDNYKLVPDAKETILLALEKKNSTRHRQLNLFTGEPEEDDPATLNFNLSHSNFLNTRPTVTRKWVIAFGSPGSGKTTTLRELHRRHPYSSLVSDNKNILTKGRHLNRYLLEAAEYNRLLYYFYFQMEILPEKFKQTIEAKEYSFIDETIYSTLAYSTSLYLLSWLTDDEYHTFLANYRLYATLLPVPSKILHFKCSPEILLKRICRRGRRVEQFYTARYLNLLNIGFEKVSQELQDAGFNIITINTEHKSTMEIVDHIYEGIFE